MRNHFGLLIRCGIFDYYPHRVRNATATLRAEWWMSSGVGSEYRLLIQRATNVIGDLFLHHHHVFLGTGDFGGDVLRLGRRRLGDCVAVNILHLVG